MSRRRSFSEIELIARRLRESLGIDDLYSPDLIDLFQGKLRKVFKGLRVVGVIDDALPNCDAQTDLGAKVITIRESVYQAAKNGDGRARMTLAHELGHLALGHSDVRFRENGHSAQIPSGIQRNCDEAEAKRFATAFLAPTYLARKFTTTEEIREKFSISWEAAEIRLSQIEAHREVSPSERWKSASQRNNNVPSRDLDTGRRLPSSVTDFLREAQRRGHPVKHLKESD